jgi:membrane-associated protein
MYNVVGAILWAIGLPIAGYFLGSAIPDIDHYLLPMIFLIIVISLIPSGYHIWKEHGDEIKVITRRQLNAVLNRSEAE